MDTQFGDTLNPDDLRPPFDKIVNDLIQEGQVLHESLTEFMLPQWQHRPLEILIIDDPSLDARATEHADFDRIYIFRGALEQVYGNILGLLSTPDFFPSIGDVNVEETPRNLPDGGFPQVPLLRDNSDADNHDPVFFPSDQQRRDVAQILAELALEFLLYHEIGHIVGGHLELLKARQGLAMISEFAHPVHKSEDLLLRHVLECDADAFACDVTSGVHLHDDRAELLSDIFNARERPPKHFALLIYLMAIGVLFRAVYPRAPVTLGQSNLSHPHPAVRACIIGSCTMARGLFDESFTTTDLADIVKDSVRNIEQVWADLFLPGQNPEAPAVWARNVGDAAMELFGSYGKEKSLLDQYARLPRKWDDWEWPDTQEST